jgi:hypothetical protein
MLFRIVSSLILRSAFICLFHPSTWITFTASGQTANFHLLILPNLLYNALNPSKVSSHRWYHLFGHFCDLGMLCSSIDHGIFLWHWNNETCYLALETNDILFGSSTRAPFLHLKQDLEKLFDLTCSEGSIL